MEHLDLRSDTVTLPTKEMRSAMSKAKLGDDVFQEDPTVQELEEVAAGMLGKESAIFLPTCTMANLTAIIGHSGKIRFPEMIAGNQQHTFLYEVGSAATLAGVHTNVLPNQEDGTLKLEDIENAVRYVDVHCPSTSMVSLENTQNQCGGIPLSYEYIESVGALTKRKGIKLHMDGARLFNASVATKVPASKICAPVDTVSICLSKGLASPAGALLVGPKSFIQSARRIRKCLGGGMRQAGVLAACGLVSLRAMTKRLDEDHETARRIANGIAELPGISVDLNKVQTNMLYFGVSNHRSEELCQELKSKHGILVGAYDTELIRAVTHKDIPGTKVDYIVAAFRDVTSKMFKQ